jgi:hypothetical protein
LDLCGLRGLVAGDFLVFVWACSSHKSHSQIKNIAELAFGALLGFDDFWMV